MAAEGPIPIEALKPDPNTLNENEHALVPYPVPGLPSTELHNAITQQPTTASWSEAGKQKIPPGLQHPPVDHTANNQSSSLRTIAATEQQIQHKNIETKSEIVGIAPNAAVIKTNASCSETNIIQEEIVVEDEQGNQNIYISIIIEQRTIQVTEISQVLCFEVNNANKALERKGNDEADANCCEKTFDFCCQSLTCHCTSPLNSKETENHMIEKNKVMMNRRARTKGYTILKGLIYPFVSDITRDFWVFFQLIFFLIQVSLSASVFILAGENYQASHLAHLAVSGLAVFLASLDCIVSFTQCSTCKACLSWCRKKAGREKSKHLNNNNFIMTTSTDKNAIDSATTTNNSNVDEAATAADSTKELDESNKDTTKCRKCFEVSRSRLDIARLFLTEFILMPMIICDMFEVATGKGFKSDVVYNRIGFVLMVHDSLGLIVFVFILRLVILGRIIHTEQKMHPTKKDIKKILNVQAKGAGSAQLFTYEFIKNKYGIDERIKKNSLQILIILFLHVLGQTIAHVLMLVALGAKIAHDTRDYGTTSTEYRYVEGLGRTRVTIVNTNVSTSSYFFYMMMATYVLPSIGFGIFFLVYNFWIQQFLTGLCLDFVRLLQICEDFNIVKWMYEKPSDVIGEFVQMSHLPTEYKNMREMSFCTKLLYSFRSPCSVIICMVYATSQLAFVLCCIYTLNSMGKATIVYLNGGGWYVYVIVASVFGAIVNIYSFLVAVIWMVIIAAAIALIPVLFIIGICVCLGYAANWLNSK